MKILSFDTATEACSAALLIDGEIIQEFQIAPQKHAELLLSMIDRLFKQASLSPKEIDAIAFGRGPGSFMGVRIATGIAQGIAYGLGRPVIPVSTLQALAQTAYDEYQVEQVLVGWDARMNEIYWGSYALDDHQFMIATQEEQLSSPESITVDNAESLYLVGNAWEVYKDELTALPTASLQPISVYPTAKAIAKIAAHQYQEGNHLLSPFQAEPTYLRNKVAWKLNEIKS